MRGLATNMATVGIAFLKGKHTTQGFVRFQRFERIVPVFVRVTVHIGKKFTNLHAKTLNLGVATIEGESGVVRVIDVFHVGIIPKVGG